MHTYLRFFLHDQIDLFKRTKRERNGQTKMFA